MYDVSAQGIDECMINVHYYYHVYTCVLFYLFVVVRVLSSLFPF